MDDHDQTGLLRFSYGLKLPQAVIRSLSAMLSISLFILMGHVIDASGSFAPVLYLILTLFVLMNLASYAELTLSLPRPGGTYAVVHNSEEGGWLAFSVGWMVTIAGLVLTALLIRGFSNHTEAFVRSLLGIDLPALLLPAGVLFLLVISHTVDRRREWSLPVIFLLGTMFSLLLVRTTDIHPGYFTSNKIDWKAAISLLVVVFSGIEITLGQVSEIRNPEANLGKAIFFPLAISGVLSAVVSILGIGLIGKTTLSDSAVPLAKIGRGILGGSGHAIFLGIGALLIMVALDRSLSVVFNQIRAMSTDGFWPGFLRRAPERSGTSTLVYGLIGAVALFLSLLPTTFLARLGGLLYLLVFMLVNVALARQEQNPASPFRLPFHPWIPYFILVMDGFLLLLWGSFLAIAGLLLIVGTLIFLLYSRHTHLQAKEGITVFKPPQEIRKTEAEHKILVPIANPDTAQTLLHLAGTLAREEGGVVMALRVITVPSRTPLSEGQRQAASERVLLDRAIAQATEEEFEIQTMTRVAREVTQGILDTANEENADQILLGWSGTSSTFGTTMGPVIDPLIQKSTCDVLVVKGEEWRDIHHILVPTAGGPNASSAAQLAATFSRVYDARVTGVYVQIGQATNARMRENEEVVQKTLQDFEYSHPPQYKVVVADNVIDGILQEAKDYDLMFIGASEERLFDQFAFGSIPQSIASQVQTTAVMVKRYRGATDFWLRRTLRGVFDLFPTLKPEEQLEVREEMEDNAQPGVNYFVLSILSSIIAALGLLISSPAVVIGAMLVAPLMSPVLGFSLGIVLGELHLIRTSIESVFKGVIASILVSILVGLLSPFKEMTPEILSRTQPTLLDMFIGLASGMAGAYAVSRKDVSAALPGVAIAAALAPPLSVVGIGIALGRPDIAGGAMLLFITNITSINLAGVIIFTLLGIKPQNWLPETKRRVRRGVIGIVVMVVIIAFPLGVIMNSIIKQTRQRQTIQQVLTEHPMISQESIVDIQRDRRRGRLDVSVTIRSPQPLDQQSVDTLSTSLESQLDQPLLLEVTTLPTTRSK